MRVGEGEGKLFYGSRVENIHKNSPFSFACLFFHHLAEKNETFPYFYYDERAIYKREGFLVVETRNGH
jgi:hypothetical protein